MERLNILNLYAQTFQHPDLVITMLIMLIIILTWFMSFLLIIFFFVKCLSRCKCMSFY